MATRAWIMTPDVAEIFFDQCLMREAVKESERIAILQELADAHKLEVYDTSSSKEQIIEALSKHYKTWVISKKEKRSV